jgi:CheY-like chemotaxis protein
VEKAVPESSPLVLIVDDDHDTRRMYDLGLSLLGATVVAAASADEAFALACALGPDAVVTDASLGQGDDGYALAERLKADPRTAAVPVLMVTGWGGGEHGARAQRAGCVALLVKPCPPDVVFQQVQSAVAARAASVPGDARPAFDKAKPASNAHGPL